MASPQDNILRLMALGNTGGGVNVGNDFGTTTRLPPGALATSSSPEEPGFLDTLKGFLPDSIEDAGLGTIVGLASAPFTGPFGALLLGGGFSSLSGQARKKEEAAQAPLGALTPGTGASLGLDENELNVLRSLPADQRNAVLQTLLSQKKRASGAGNKVVAPGGALVDPGGNAIFRNPAVGKYELGVVTNSDGTRSFRNIADPATADFANQTGANISKLTPPKQSNVLLTNNKKDIISVNKNDPEAIKNASELGFINTVGTKGAGGKDSDKFFDVSRFDPEGNFIEEKIMNADQLNAANNNLGTDTITALPLGKEQALTKLKAQDISKFEKEVNNLDNLSVTSKNILDVLRQSPAASTFAGGFAEKTSSIAAGIAGLFNLAVKDIPTLDVSKSQQGKLKKLAKQSANLDSATLELAFTIAELNGQTGRGLSDRDFQIALDIVGAGGDPEVVASTLGKLIKRLVRKSRNTAKNLSLNVNTTQEEVFNKVSAQADQFIGSSGSRSKMIRFGRDPNTGRPVRLN